MISNSGHDENGKYSGGVAGDQTGDEWKVQNWYSRPWTVVLRHPNSSVRSTIASLGRQAANNDNIGYNQADRYSYWNCLKKAAYAPAYITTKCNADCSAGVAANVKATGYLLNIPELKNVSIYAYTGNLRLVLETAGFKALTDSKYLTSDKYLLEGDILLCEGHHVATNLDDGSNTDVKDWFESEIGVDRGLTVTSQSLAIRRGPSTSFAQLGTLAKNDVVFPKGKAFYKGRWWAHIDGSIEGWVSMAWLKGWVKENSKWWYLLGSGEYDYYKSTVAQIDKKYYAFDVDGWMLTADRINPDGSLN